jgi:hypothetical protein
MSLTLTKLPLIRLKSFSGSAVVYTVDRQRQTCTCREFAEGGHCKHLDEFGVYKRREFIARTHPTFSQALSGLVKSIRMRRVEDAVYWLMYLDGFPASEERGKKAARFRVARRILIGSAEDGHSISVMESVASNFRFLCKVDTPLVYLEPVINFVPLESRKYPNVSLSLTMEAWGTRGKSAIQAM